MENKPLEMEEPPETFGVPEGVWMRALWMLVFAILFGIGESVLLAVAVIQFLWMIFSKNKNTQLVSFGQDLGRWLQDVARFQTGVSDDKPFPWRKWAA